MRRRQITLSGQPLNARQRKFNELKAAMRERFQGKLEMQSDVLESMFAYMQATGWDKDDTESFAKQAVNQNRPAVEAFLFHHEHTIDQLLITQGGYTGFTDTAEDPNYALRHKGQTELIFRRQTPGDLLLMRAAHNMSLRHPAEERPATEIRDYWTKLWPEVLLLVLPENGRSRFDWIWGDYYAFCSMAFTFVDHQYGRFHEFVEGAHNARSFCDPSRRSYVGVSVSWESRRVTDGYARGWFFDKVEEGSESLSMAACILVAYGIDLHARAIQNGWGKLPIGSSVETYFYDFLGRMYSHGKRPIYFKEDQHGNQSTNAPTSQGSANSFNA